MAARRRSRAGRAAGWLAAVVLGLTGGAAALLGPWGRDGAAPPPGPLATVARECREWARSQAPGDRPLPFREPLRGVYYFQPYAGFINLWTDLDFELAARDFARIREDGFNSIILLVPWGVFQTAIDPIRYSEAAFAKLDRLIALARDHGLGVIARVGSHERIPRGATGVHFAAAGVLTRQADLRAFLDFLSEASRRVARHPNLLFVFWSWEDVYAFPEHVFRTEALRREFIHWLRRGHPLWYLDWRWGEANDGWDEIALPDWRASPRANLAKFHDYWRFHDEVLIRDRAVPCFLKALAEGHPGVIVSFQPRVDVDDAYSHRATFQAPRGYRLLMSWFAPYHSYNVDTTKVALDADDAMAALRWLLGRLQRWSDLPVFFDQFFFRQFHVDPALPRLRDDVEEVRFVRRALPLLCASPRVVGYALWTWRDYVLNLLDNPGFEEGLAGWAVEGSPRVGGPAYRGAAAALLDAESSLAVGRDLEPDRTYTLAGFVSAPEGSSLTLQLTLARSDGGEARTEAWVIPVPPGGYRPFERSFRSPPVPASARLTLRPARNRVLVDEMQLYSAADTTGLYSLTGEPRPMREVVARLNRHACGRPPQGRRGAGAELAGRGRPG